MLRANCKASFGVGVLGVGGRDRDAGQAACSQLGLGLRSKRCRASAVASSRGWPDSLARISMRLAWLPVSRATSVLLATSSTRPAPASRSLRAIQRTLPLPSTNKMVFTFDSVRATRSGSSRTRC